MNTTFHDILGRIGPFAIIDIVLTLILSEFILYNLENTITLKLRLTMYVTMLYISILVHLITNTKTPLTNMVIS